MPSKGKLKGNRFEYEVRDLFIDNGIDCKRSYGSDGRSLGLDKEVDLLVEFKDLFYSLQCKVRKKISTFIKPSKDIYAQIIKEDRGEIICVLRLKDFIKLMKS
tara:strand:- start:2 stop:310 length:309 start_codon:yes stop_codon:yes gene_type:complete